MSLPRQEALRARAEGLGQALPPLLAEAERLAGTVMLGEHGRRRAGQGDEFWQYRPAHPGDSLRMIDWRRSAQSDGHFVRQREWQAAQSVMLWVDPARSMAFSGAGKRPSKRDRAQLLALATAILLLRGGERVGLAGSVPPRGGRAQVAAICEDLLLEEAEGDHAPPPVTGLVPHGRAVFFSDFLGPMEPLAEALSRAAGQGVKGCLVQILDPVEEEFPFDGRVIFESMAGAIRHETRQAAALRGRYLARLEARRAEVAALARAVEWQFTSHHTGATAQSVLLWLYRALEGAG